jgi:CHAT domain-containing protein
MRIRRAVKISLLSAAGVFLVGIGLYYYATTPHASSAPAGSAQNLLDRADALAWGNLWASAQPLYRQSEVMFEKEGQRSKALYARVSQIPPKESSNSPSTIVALSEDLQRPEAGDPETRLRILTIRGMLETNYNASEALATWKDVSALATSLGHISVATRAMGEEGIAAFLLGDTQTAKTKVVRAWALSKIENDPAATVRYASVFGAGLVQIHRYKEALTPLDEAIRIAAKYRGRVAYPTIAVYAKIDALVGLHRLDEALGMANEALAQLQPTAFDAHKAQVYLSRGNIYRDRGDWDHAIHDYKESIRYSTEMVNNRELADAGGLLAQAYKRTGNLPAALDAIDAAISANAKLPEELYLVPRNLAIKAEIENATGNTKAADELYQKATTLVSGMLHRAPTLDVQRYLLTEMSDVYSGYFSLLTAEHRYDDAFRTLEQVRGRIETTALEHHVYEPAHPPSASERDLTALNLALINADSPVERERLSNAIYLAELGLAPVGIERDTFVHPVSLRELKKALPPNALLVEYVLAEPNSYALAITANEAVAVKLEPKSLIEANATRYVSELRSKKEDRPLSEELFRELLGPVAQYSGKTDLIIVPDSSLHLLPFSALSGKGEYVVATHTVDIEPSSTVYSLIQKRARENKRAKLDYLGVAAWNQAADTRNPILRAISGPDRSEFLPLPESKAEVERISRYLSPPGTILLGAQANEGNFKSLVNGGAQVIHLALHGYVDLDYPVRSALVFAPDGQGNEDGLLQVREIRNLNLNSKLVTLSACSTGVGPVGEVGVASLVNAFIQAGAVSVVSTLWDVEDKSTEHFMVDFYSNLGQHKRKVDALRTAQLHLLEDKLPPYFWAGFQLAGDPYGTL